VVALGTVPDYPGAGDVITSVSGERLKADSRGLKRLGRVAVTSAMD